MNLRTLIFDLGNVFLFFDHEKMVRQISAFCSLDPKIVKETIFSETFGLGYETGKITTTQFYEHFCELANNKLDKTGLLTAASDIFEPNEILIDQIPKFRKQNIRLVLLSNTCEMHFDYVLQRFPFLQHFDDFILSHKVGSLKPDPTIYKAAIKSALCPLEECLFVDDMKENIQGAENLNIPSHHFIDTNRFLNHLSEKGLLLHD